MNYIERIAEKQILNLAKQFPVVMITGPRQVGKTTLLTKVIEKTKENITFVSFDNITLRTMAKKDPELFLETYKPPLAIDEFQYVPNLLSYIKLEVDKQRYESLNSNKNCNGLYYLTGSQVFHTMKNISETLAGRVGILDLYGLSTREIDKKTNDIFLPDINQLKKIEKGKRREVLNLYKRIWKGSYPDIWIQSNIDIETYYDGYIRTYIERDIRDLVLIKDELKFIHFITAIAVRTAQELNYTSICEDVGISLPTAKEWMSHLVNTHLVYLLQPFSTKAANRMIKRPKVYFMDTGLACYLARYKDEKTLESSAFNGAIFETYVVSEIIKSYANNGYNPKRYLSFYRDKNQKEIDLIIEYNNKIYPIEIKKNKNPGIDATKNFSVLNRLDNVQKGVILCMCEEIEPIDRNYYKVPIDYI